MAILRKRKRQVKKTKGATECRLRCPKVRSATAPKPIDRVAPLTVPVKTCRC
ncbi:hypothetical protein [Fervidibacter sp.]